MSRLINANFTRLWKSKTFRICLAASFGYSAVRILLVCLSAMRYENPEGRLLFDYSYDYILFSGCTVVMLLSAVFTALFIGTEYSDKTLRNKLIVGCTRSSVYFANLGVTLFAAEAMLTASFAGILIVGLPLGARFDRPVGEILCRMGICVVTIAAMTAIDLMLSMLISRRTGSVIVTAALILSMLGGAEFLQNTLGQNEFFHWSEFDENGAEIVHTEKNPEYFDGSERGLLTAVDNLLPGNQIRQLQGAYRFNDNDLPQPVVMPLYSLGVLAAATAVGAIVFRGKDLK